MAAVEVSQTLEYRGGQLNAAPVLEVENFTNWKKRFMCHIIGIEPQFENIISNSPYIPMTVGQRKPETQWTPEERKAAKLDQRLKSLIMSVLPDDQMNSVINCLTAKSTWDDLILYYEGPSDMKESRVMDLKLCYNTFKFKKSESLTQTFTIYKALMNELVNDGIKLSKLEINTGFINGLPKKWLAFCQSLRNTNHVKESELASLFGKLKYEENLINSIYDTNKEKTLVPITPLSTAFFSSSIVQDFQDSPGDEEDTRSSQEYMNDLEEEYQARALLAKSKRFFKKGTQRFTSAKATDQTECHKCGNKGHFARDCWSKTSVPSYQSPFQRKLLHSSEHKPKPRHTKYFEAKYNKVKAKLALFKEVSSDDNEVTEVKALMALADEERVSVGKESAKNGEWIKISMKKIHTLLEMEDNDDRKYFLDYLVSVNKFSLKRRKSWESTNSLKIPPALGQSSADNSKVSTTGSNKPKLFEAKDSTLLNHDTGKVPSNESQRNTTDHSVVVFDSSATDYDSTDESLVCSTPLPPLGKLTGVELVSGPNTIKSILKSISTFKAETLKGVIINEPSSAPARGNKSSSASKTNSAPASKLKNVKMEDDPPLAITPSHKPYRCTQSSLEQPLESEDNDLANSDEAQDVSPPKSTVPGIQGKKQGLKTEMKKLAKHMDSWDKDFKNEWLYTCKLEKKLCEVEDKVEKKEEEKVEMKKYITELERMKECMEEMKGKWELMDYKYEMMARIGRAVGNDVAKCACEDGDRLGWYDMDERSNDAIDVLKTYGTTPPPGLQDPSNDP
ncbi:retrovirus-related pol polyprotein from transposon TNT 1-94 [Tanacetum coccineum]